MPPRFSKELSKATCWKSMDFQGRTSRARRIVLRKPIQKVNSLIKEERFGDAVNYPLQKSIPRDYGRSAPSL